MTIDDEMNDGGAHIARRDRHGRFHSEHICSTEFSVFAAYRKETQMCTLESLKCLLLH